MNHILVTGGCGYVGSVLVPKLLANHRVTVFDVQWFGNYLKPHRDLTVIKQDIRDPLPEPSEPIDAIINLAAIADDHTSELDHALTWSVGAQGTLALAEYAVKHGVRRFIHASSGSIYGATEQPATESTELHPQSYYNQVKHVAERIIASYQQFAVHIVRPGAVCGWSPRLRLETTVNNLTAQALSTREIKVYGGSQLRPFVHIEDLCDAYIWLLDQPPIHFIYNVSFENLSVMDVANTVRSYTGAEKILCAETTDMRSYHIDSTLIRQHGFMPAYSAEIAIRQLVTRYIDREWRDEDKNYNIRTMRGWKK